VLRLRRFDDGRAQWWSFPHDRGSCWLPAERFRPRLREEKTVDDTEPSVLELDAPLDLAASAPFLALEEAGVITRFDEGTRLTGMRLHVEALDEQTRAILRESARWPAAPSGRRWQSPRRFPPEGTPRPLNGGALSVTRFPGGSTAGRSRSRRARGERRSR
jgi:hypothetical protein